jgi:hypothetical protein
MKALHSSYLIIHLRATVPPTRRLGLYATMLFLAVCPVDPLAIILDLSELAQDVSHGMLDCVQMRTLDPMLPHPH